MIIKRLNFTTILGALIAATVVYFGGFNGVKNPMMFLDTHALILVVGGTMAATLLAFSLKDLSQLFDFMLFNVFTKKKTDHLKLFEEMSFVNLHFLSNPMSLKGDYYSHVFLQESVKLLVDEKFSYKEMKEILEDRVYIFKKKYQQDAKILNAIAKYPPAFGLLGATTGMISMMTNLGGSGGTAAIGQAMAVALVATFWGIAVANFVLLPLSDNAQKSYLADEFTRNFIKEGILLVKQNTDQKVFMERLRSQLPLAERVESMRSNIFSFNLIKMNFGTGPNRGKVSSTNNIKTEHSESHNVKIVEDSVDLEKTVIDQSSILVPIKGSKIKKRAI